jgi:hypothetical protein
MYLLGLLILSPGASPQQPSEPPDPFPAPLFGPVIPPTVLVGQAAWDMRLRNRPLQVCGYLYEAKDYEEGQVLEANGAYLVVERSERPPAFGEGTCIRGVVYRRDGLSEAQAIAARLPEHVSPHGAPDHHVLYRCNSTEDCDELARTGPRGRRRAP